MARPRARRRPRRRLRRLVVLGALALVVLLYYRPLRAYEHAHRAVATQAAQVRALEARKRRLEERLAEVRSGATLVRAARRLGLVKPGEELFIVRGIEAWRRAHARR
jgi:cell division protein FtsB